MTTVVGTPPGVTASGYKDKPFAPGALPGLTLWLDADDAATFSFSSGTVVSQWRDKSPGGHHFAQATVAQQPTRNGLINGRSSIVFDNANSHSLTSPSWAMTKPYTVLTISKNTDPAAAQRTTFMTVNDGRIYRTSGDQIAIYQGGGPVTSGLWGSVSPRAVAVVFNGASSKLTVDGGTTVNADAGGQPMVGDGRSHAVGANAATGGEFWKGDICEVVVCSGEISPANLDKWFSYARTKWATP